MRTRREKDIYLRTVLINMHFLFSKIQKMQTFWGKVSRRLSRYAKNYTLRVVYFIVLFVISLAGSKIALQKSSGGSQWQSVEKLGGATVTKHSRDTWVWGYLNRAFRTKNFWLIPLLPFLLLVKLLQDPAEAPSPDASLIYTLY